MGKTKKQESKKALKELSTTSKKEDRKQKKEFKKRQHREKDYGTREEVLNFSRSIASFFFFNSFFQAGFRELLHGLGLRIEYVDADGNWHEVQAYVKR